jgi:RNA polymerase sigma factor (TIGR02999 family)
MSHDGRQPAVQGGEPAGKVSAGVPEELIEEAYRRLHELAHGRMRREAPGGLLQTTALVHEAYLRLLRENKRDWTPRQFLAAAAEAMRRILVETARRPSSSKGRRQFAVSLDELPEVRESATGLDVIALDEALEALQREDERMYQVVMLRYFAGLEVARIAELMGLSTRTVHREWKCARLWLLAKMETAGGHAGEGSS